MKTEIHRRIPALFSSLLSPHRCAVCGSFNTKDIPVCAECLENRFFREAEKPRHPRCLMCGRPLISARNICVTCRNKGNTGHSIDGIQVLFPYDSANQTLLTAWKIAGLRGLSPLFASCLDRALKRLQPSPLAIIPVPPRQGKVREKGWDQMEELAVILHRRYGYRILRPLVRRAGIQQKKLGHEGRLSNLKGAIDCISADPLPSPLFVLDDLVATGSTLEACAAALKAAGAGKVYGLALFYD